MANFEIHKVFDMYDMPSDVMMEVCEETKRDTAVRVFLTGHDYQPLARAWLLENGAEESDEFVYIWIE